ncbi:AN1-type zinc finger protein 5-like [Grus japonensis]|uniref:AN1-type zinc finger protein 5-like n=1 Tax=Grus japonensis TaxID=30415 RepID=A0ABC9YHI0_GRUJA
MKTMVRQAVPLQPMEDDGGADIHLQPVEDLTPEQVEKPKGGCDPVGSLRWSKLLAGPVDLWRKEPTLEQGKSGRSPPPEDEEAAETTCDELTVIPIPCPPVLLGGRR